MGVREFAAARSKEREKTAAEQKPTGVRAFAAARRRDPDATTPAQRKENLPQVSAGMEQARKSVAEYQQESAFPGSPNQTLAALTNGDVEALKKARTEAFVKATMQPSMSEGVKGRIDYRAQQNHIKKMNFDVAAARKQVDEDAEYAGMKNREKAAARRKEIDDIEAYQKAVGYATLTGNPDFAEKSKRTTEWNKYDKAVYGEDYNAPRERLSPEQLKEYEKIRKEQGEPAAEVYMAQTLNYEGGEWYPYGIHLTDDEKKIFNYLLNTGGDEKAAEYLRFMTETVNGRAALAEYEAKNHDGFLGTLRDYNDYFWSGVETGVTGVAKFFSNDKIPYSKNEQYSAIAGQKRMKNAKSGFSRLGEQVAHDLLSSAGNMAPSYIIGALNPVAGKVAFGLSAGGGAKQEALRGGYTATQATAYGILNGAAEVALQDLVGGIAQLGGKGLSNMLSKIPGGKMAAAKIENVLARISVGKQTTARVALHALDNLGGEGLDEYLQEILNPVFRNICLGEHNEFKPFTEEALYSGMIGALMALGSTAINLPADIHNAKIMSRYAYDAQQVRDGAGVLIDGTADIQREDVVKAREELQQKIDSRKELDLGDIADYAKTLQKEEIAHAFGYTEGTETRTVDDIRAQLGDAANGDAVAEALYGMQKGEFSERDAETVRSSPEGRALFSEYFDTNITENTSAEEISAAVRDVSGDDYRSISYEAQQLLKSVRASNGYSDGADAAFYRAYFEGFSGKARSESTILSNAALDAAYQMGVDAKNDVGAFHTVGNTTISKEATAFLSKAAKDLGLSITYGGKGSVANGGVRRGYANSYRGIHIYEDAKVQEVGGKTLTGGDAAARIILGHELTHVLQEQSPEQYEAFEAFALQQRSEQGSKVGLDLVSEYMRDLRLDKQSATDEVVADYAMRTLFSDMKTAREVTKHHSGVAEAIRRAFAWVREKLGIRTSEVDRATAMWNKAYNESRRNASGAVDLAERMAGYHADRIAEAETSATVKDSRAIDNRPPKDYNAFDEALDRRQWAQLYAEVERRESEGQIEDGANYYFTKSGTPKLAIFRYDASAKNKTEVVAAYKSSSALNDAIINLKEIYENESGNFMPGLHRLAESGELQQYDVRVRNYQYAPVPNRGASGVSGQSSRIGADGNAGEGTSQNGVGHGSRVAGANEITNKADSAESAFSIGGVKNSIAQNNAKLIRYFTGEVRESGDVYLSDRDKAKIAHNVKSGNGWMNESTSSGYVYTDMCFYTFKYNADRSITVTEELFLEDDADRIKTIRREFASNGNKATIRRNDSTLEGKTLRAGIGTEYSTPLDNRRKVGGDAEVYGQKSGSGRLRVDNRSGTDSTAISETSEKQNKVKADSTESAFSVGEVKDSISSTDAIDIDFERRLNAMRGRQASVSEVLRRNEREARDVKREFLPDMKTVGEVARSFAEIGLAADATTADLVKATTDAAVAMRAAYLERRIANEATKDAKSRTAAKKLLEAAEMVKLPDGMSKTQVAAAMADALYQTNTSDKRTVKELVAQYGAIKPGEKPSRTLSVPKRTDEGRNVSAAVRTVLEARVTPDGMVPTIEDAIESGDFSYETITDKASLALAKSKVRKDYQKAYDDFRDAARRGIVSKDQITLGFELYNQAANAGTADGARQAMDILSDIVSTSRSSAQTLAAMRLLKKMSPEGQLYTVEKTINRINESIGTRKKRQLDRAHATVDDAMWNGRDDAAEEMARSIVQMGQGLPVEEWVDAIGDLVGDGIAARLSPKTKAERLVSQNIRNDLLKFAEDYLPRAAGERKSKTAAERLSDYFANKDNYEKAWERAKTSIREKYADNPDALAQLDAFLVGTLSYDDVKGSGVMMSAIAKAAIGEDSSIRQLALRANLGDAEGVALDIYNRLNKTVQASDTDAVVLRDAIRRYVYETAAEKATPQTVENEIRRAVREAGTTIGEIIRSDTNERASVLRRIQSYLIENLGISEESAQTAADMIQKHFTKMTEEKSRAALENALKDKPRSVRKTAEERFREYANLGAFDGEYNEAISKKLFGETVRINEKLVQKFRAAETEEQRTEILKDIYRDIGRQIPSTWLEKWTAWRYLSMLFNLTTHIRNVVGNAGFAPIVMAKNKVAWLIESGVGLVNKDFEKTKAFLVGHGDLVKAADADFAKYQEVLFEGEKYRDTFNGNKYIDEGRHIFRDTLKIGDKGVLNHLYDFNRRLLSAEDMIFKKQYYVYALASWCKKNGITAEQIRRGEGLDAARAYAIREAQRNTYNDANAFSDLMTKIGHTGNKYWDTVVSGAQPFLRTPANIAARGLEYSPAGLLWTVTRGAYQLRNGEISAAQYIDNLAQGLTGSVVVALGLFLAHLGIIGFGGDDDKEKDFEKMYGHQQYSIEIGGKSITLDWLAPESIPFFTGVNMYELMQDGGFSFEDMQQVLELITDPMLNMSMLQGIGDMIDNAKWSNTNALGSVAFGIAENLISQNLPTVLGKFERITQPDRMTTYVDKNQPLLPSAQRALGKLSQKVPGLDYNQIPYIDAWGEKETNTNAAWRAFDQLMNPAYTATVDSTPLEQEIIRLHRATGENDMFPTRAQKSFTVKRRKDGKPLSGDETKDEVEAVDFNLTAEQYVKYATYRGKVSKRIAEALIKSPYYKQADDATQREMFAAAYDIADVQAKMLVSDYRPEGWVAKAISACKETGITEMQYITLYTQQKNIDSLADGEKVNNLSSARKMQMLYKATLSDAQRERLADDFGIGKKVRGWREKDVEKFLSWYKEG